jgi:hypothetical protein
MNKDLVLALPFLALLILWLLCPPRWKGRAVTVLTIFSSF